MTQLVKLPTIDFGSGHGLAVHEIEPHVRICADSTGFSLSPSLCAPFPLALSIKINKHFKINK